MPRFNFTLRMYQGEATSLSTVSHIEISDICVLAKDDKFEKPRTYKAQLKKHKFSVEVKGTLFKGGGSHSSPCITFKQDYIDIVVCNFPRYPAFYQCKYIAQNRTDPKWFNPKETLHDGFPTWEKFRKLEILNLERL